MRVIAMRTRVLSEGGVEAKGDNPMSHADVVVASRGAVLLSLRYEDFSRALKGILGLRQQCCSCLVLSLIRTTENASLGTPWG
eukprot:1157640-Pelagomonas_calceolata.AAC.5